MESTHIIADPRGHVHPEPSTLVIFGSRGDLSRRKLLPALYNLFTDRMMPREFAVLGLSRKSHTREEFIDDVKAQEAPAGCRPFGSRARQATRSAVQR